MVFVEAVEECNRDGAAKYSVLSRREDMKAQDDALLRHFHGEWSQRMGRPASNPVNQMAKAAE